MKKTGLAKSAFTFALLGIATDPGGIHMANAVSLKSAVEQKASSEIKQTS
jgi:hypothetical protein